MATEEAAHHAEMLAYGPVETGKLVRAVFRTEDGEVQYIKLDGKMDRSGTAIAVTIYIEPSKAQTPSANYSRDSKGDIKGHLKMPASLMLEALSMTSFASLSLRAETVFVGKDTTLQRIKLISSYPAL